MFPVVYWNKVITDVLKVKLWLVKSIIIRAYIESLPQQIDDYVYTSRYETEQIYLITLSGSVWNSLKYLGQLLETILM